MTYFGYKLEQLLINVEICINSGFDFYKINIKVNEYKKDVERKWLKTI